jgi:hypothetical protein
MGSEATPDCLYGAGLYYQDGTNYNWYDPATGLTGVQATPKWDDVQPIVGFEGQDLQYSVCWFCFFFLLSIVFLTHLHLLALVMCLAKG